MSSGLTGDGLTSNSLASSGLTAEAPPSAEALRESGGEWLRAGLSTEPIDHVAAEKAVDALYTLVTGAPAPQFIWCESPLAAVLLIAEAPGQFGAPLRERIRLKPWESARAWLLSQYGQAELTRGLHESCQEAVRALSPLINQITEAVVAADTEEDSVRTRRRLALTYADHGQLNGAWLPLWQAYPPPGQAGEVIRALAAVSRRTHWWWAYEGVAVLCERPIALHVDERGRLHRGEGPALAYRDGFELYRWRGVTIPATFAKILATLTPEEIRTERNAELRRIMLEHYGYEQYIVDSGAEPVQHDEAGRLWRVRLPGDEPITMVEVVNASAEPDGTFRRYWLRVPPHTKTAKAGVAWTFGLSEEEYRPVVQT